MNNGLQGRINKTVSESFLHQKRQKKELPCVQEIKKLHMYLKEQQNKYFNCLQTNGFSITSWLQLLKLTLISILVFNRRRPGKLERTLITDLKSLYVLSKENDPDTYDKLTSEGKTTVKTYARFTIRGKLARGVPVLLDKLNNKYIQYLIEHPQAAGVLDSNPYAFGLPQSSTGAKINFKYLRAVPLLRKYTFECGVKKPCLLRATLLRKHVATHSALINLDNNNIKNLQDFLGHAAKIHKDYYRQPLANRDIINMSKVFEIAQGIRDEVEDESEDICVSDKRSNVSTDDSEIIINRPNKRKRLLGK